MRELYNKKNHTNRYGATGYTKISKLINRDRTECQKFRSFLENLKILKTKENNKNVLLELSLKMAMRKVSKKLEDIGGI